MIIVERGTKMSKWVRLKTIICLLVLVVFMGNVGGGVSASSSTLFADVQNNYWAKKEIEYLYSKKIINGYEEKNAQYFKPEAQVTRAQAAKMIMVALDQEEKKTKYSSFEDVPTKHWASGWIEQANQMGIMSGNEKGLFNPEESLTRAQMSKILAKAFGLDISAAEEKEIVFNDIKPNFWAATFINALYYNGISNGSGNYFKPNEKITRSHFSVFISRAINEDFRVPLLGSATSYGKVTVSSLNVRSAPNSSSTVLGKLKLGETVTVHEINGYWAKISYNNTPAYVHKTYLKLRNVNDNPLKDRIIVIDAGHGGKDPGAVNGKYNEKSIVINVAKGVQAKLQSQGARVIMTRTGDTYPTLSDRVDITKNSYAEVFVSIHANAAGASASGAETFYNTSKNENGTESSELAKEIQKQIVALADMNDRGAKNQEFYVIKNQNIPSVLVELGFITNSNDLSKLVSSQYQELYAEAIYRGIKNYYSK